MEENQKETPFLNNAFIAIHHDEIMDVGVHTYNHHIDKDTRIIDGTNHIAIPAFIEVDSDMSKQEVGNARQQHEFFMRYMLHGTTSVHVRKSIAKNLLQEYHYEVLSSITPSKMKVVYPIQQMKAVQPIQSQKPFCISCADANISLQNQMMAAQLLAMKEGVDAYSLLESLTVHPATYLNLLRHGKIKRGFFANILLVSTVNVHDLFYSFDQNNIAHIIHKGVRIYPNLLI